MGQPGGVPSLIPELVNAAGQAAVFSCSPRPRAGAPGCPTRMSYDLGAPQPTTDMVQSLLLDGERPFGYRASNREIHLPVKITAPDIPTMNAARELLMSTVDQQSWTLTWTPGATGLPLIFDCFRALPASDHARLPVNRQPVTVDHAALPRAALRPVRPERAPAGRVLLPAAGRGRRPPGPRRPRQLRARVRRELVGEHVQKYVTGPHLARTGPRRPRPQAGRTYTKSGLGLNLTGLPVLSVWLGQSYDTPHFGPWPAMASNVTLAWTLTDNGWPTPSSSPATYNKMPLVELSGQPGVDAGLRPHPAERAGLQLQQRHRLLGQDLQLRSTRAAPCWPGIQAWLDASPPTRRRCPQPASQRGVIY